MAICPNCNVEVSGNFCPLCAQAVPQGPQQPQAPRQPQQPQQQIPPQQPYQQPMAGPMPMGRPGVPLPQKAIAALILGIIVVILMFIAGAMPWYSVTDENGFESKADYTFQEEIVEYGSSDTETDLEDLDGDFDNVAGTTGLLMLLGTLMIIIVIVFICLLIGMYYMRMHRYHRLLGNLTLLFILIALIFVLIAPIYYMVAWSDEMDKYTDGERDSFIGSDTAGDYETKWGPGIGWILAIVAIIMILVTMIVVKLGSDEVQKLAPYAPPLPRPQYMPRPPPQPYQPPVYQPPPQYPPQQPPYQPPQYPQPPPQHPPQ